MYSTVLNKDLPNTLRKQNILFAILLLSVAVLSIWKAPYGYSSPDESFYLTIPKRILQGDNLLTHEWHLSQFAGILTVPIMWLYNTIGFDNGEYMVLFFRYAYVTVHILTSIFIYHNIKSKPNAAIAMVLYMFYVPKNMMTLSYNTMGIMFLTAALAALNNSKNKRTILFSGLFFSASVLCNPFLIFLYFAYFVLLCLSSRFERLKNLCFIDKKVFLFFTIGCVPLGVLTVILLLQSPIATIQQVIPLILSDPEHNERTFLSLIRSYVESPLAISYSFYIIPIFVLLLVASFVFIKKPKFQNYIWILGSFVIFVFSVCTAISPNVFINFFQFPVPVLGLLSFITCQKKNWKLMIGFYIPAIIYTFLMHLTSNLGFESISSAAVVASIPSIMFIIDKIKDFDGKFKKYIKIIPITVIGFVLLSTLFLRINNTFWDEDLKELDYKIEEGYSKGLITSENKFDKFNMLSEDTEFIKNQKNGKVLYFSFETGLYLADNKQMASFSAWISVIPWNGIIPQNPDCDRFKEYYKLFPEKRPDYVYIESKDYSIVEYIMRELSLQGELFEGEQGYSLIVK